MLYYDEATCELAEGVKEVAGGHSDVVTKSTQGEMARVEARGH